MNVSIASSPILLTLGIIGATVFIVLVLASLWRMFVKADRHGWISLVPIYNIYSIIKIAHFSGWILLLYFIPIVNILTHLIVSIGLAKAFKRKPLFGLFLWLLPCIGYAILGFGSSKYVKVTTKEPRLRLKPLHRNLLISLVIILEIISSSILVWAVYSIYQQTQIQNSVSYDTSKFAHVGFDVTNEWNDQYRLTVMYPQVDHGKLDEAARARIDHDVSIFRQALAIKSPSAPPYELQIIGGVNFANDKVINLEYYGTWSVGGPSHQLVVNALFNRTDGSEIKTSNLFKDTSYLKVFSGLARKELPGVLGKNYNEALVNQGTNPIAANFDQFEIIDTNTIDLVFQPGQVAALEYGEVRVPVTLDALQNNWNRDVISVIFPEYLNQVKAQEAAAAEAAKKAAEEQEAEKRKTNTPLPANGNVDCSQAKCIALTFDDGPGAGTNTVLDTLEQYHVHATFMLIGLQVGGHAAQLKREVADGDGVGSHTWDHADLTSLSIGGIQSEVDRTQQAIFNVVGKTPFMLRPPYGAYNKTVLDTVKMPLILWSVDPDDWKDRDANIVYQRVMSHVKRGAIVLSHDIYPTTAAAYQRIIPDLINQGYTLVTVSNLLGISSSNAPVRVYTGNY